MCAGFHQKLGKGISDKEYLDLLSTIEIHTEILLGILRYTLVKDTHDEKLYLAELKKKLRFQNDNDHILLRCCIDVIEDSQNAIKEVYKYGLATASERDGEMYLRLYGVLNAVYLQMGAVIDLARLFNMPNQKDSKQKIKSLQVIHFRNKVASHTTNYVIPGTRSVDFFRLAQSTLSKWGSNLLIVGADTAEDFALIPALKEFTEMVELLLLEIVQKELFSRKFNSEHFEWLEYRYNYILKYRNVKPLNE